MGLKTVDLKNVISQGTTSCNNTVNGLLELRSKLARSSVITFEDLTTLDSVRSSLTAIDSYFQQLLNLILEAENSAKISQLNNQSIVSESPVSDSPIVEQTPEQTPEDNQIFSESKPVLFPQETLTGLTEESENIPEDDTIETSIKGIDKPIVEESIEESTVEKDEH